MNRCGKCKYWLKKSDCPKEKEGLKPSCNDIYCSKFSLDNWYENKSDRLQIIKDNNLVIAIEELLKGQNARNDNVTNDIKWLIEQADNAGKNQQKIDVAIDELGYALRTGNDELKEAYIKNAIRFLEES